MNIDRVIDRLFQRLAATYGADWDRSISTAPLADIRTVWAHELQGFTGRLWRVAWALENMPERCPNVIAFKNLCRAAPDSAAPAEAREAAPAIETTTIDPSIKKMMIDAMKSKIENVGMKDWAYALKARDEAGEKLNANQIRCYKNALGLHAGGMQI